MSVPVMWSTDEGRTWRLIYASPRSIAGNLRALWRDGFGNAYRPPTDAELERKGQS